MQQQYKERQQNNINQQCNDLQSKYDQVLSDNNTLLIKQDQLICDYGLLSDKYNSVCADNDVLQKQKELNIKLQNDVDKWKNKYDNTVVENEKQMKLLEQLQNTIDQLIVKHQKLLDNIKTALNN